MNTFKRQHTLAWGFSFLCAVTILAASAARSQDAVFSGPNRPVPHHILPLHILNGEIVGVDGGLSTTKATLSNLVSYLEARDHDANIILPADLSQTKIGDLQLRDAPTDLALQAAGVASGNHFVVDVRHGAAGTGKTLLILEKPPTPVAPPSDVTVQAFSLTGYLSYLKFDMQSRQALAKSDPQATLDIGVKLNDSLDKLHEIINETLAMEQNQKEPPIQIKPPQINFYKDADLLIVIGSPVAVETAGKIISALPGQNSKRMLDVNTLPVDLQNNGSAANSRAGSTTSQP